MDDMSGLTTSPCHFSFGIEVVPLVRGHLAAALELLPLTSDAALEVCAAWSELDEAAQLPTMHDVHPSGSLQDVLHTARALLHDAMVTAPSTTHAMCYARAVRHLDDALTSHTVAAGGA